MSSFRRKISAFELDLSIQVVTMPNIFRSPFSWNALSLDICEAGISIISSMYKNLDLIITL